MAKTQNRKAMLKKRDAVKTKLEITKQKVNDYTAKKKALLKELRELDAQLAQLPADK